MVAAVAVVDGRRSRRRRGVVKAGWLQSKMICCCRWLDNT